MAHSKGHNISHPWMTAQAKRAVSKHVTPRTAQRLLKPHNGVFSGEIIRIDKTLRQIGDDRMYEHRRSVKDPQTHSRMARTLSRELEFYAELCRNSARMPVQTTWRPWFYDHRDADEQASLLMCFAIILTRRAEQLSTPVRPASVRTCQLNLIVEQGAAAALDGETHVVRASVSAYAALLIDLERLEWHGR